MKLLSFISILMHSWLVTTLVANELNSLSPEQKVKTYSILIELEKNLYDSKIILNFKNGMAKSYNIQDLKFELISSLDNESLITSDKISDSSFTLLKSKKIRNPTINFFSESNGKRIASFQCKSIKIGKSRIGFLEIPSNKILFDIPSFNYY